jgi:hypothetical protein
VRMKMRPPGLKPGFFLQALRGAEAPLFHVTVLSLFVSLLLSRSYF